MREVVRAVLSTQQTAVSEYHSFLEGASATPLPPLPFGPNERRRFRADGEQETATVQEIQDQNPNVTITLDEGEDMTSTRDLYYCVPRHLGVEEWQEAKRPNFELLNDAGEVVDRDTWKKQFNASSTGFWAKPVSSM